MSRTFLSLAIALSLASSSAAQSAYFSGDRSYVIQDQQDGTIIQPTPDGDGSFFNQDPDQQSDIQKELDELKDFTGFKNTDSEITNLGVDDRQGGPGGGHGPGGDMGDLATRSNNPVGGLWMLWMQNDFTLYEGPLDGKRIFNTTIFQPVLPVQLTDKWRVINRPVFMVHNFEVPTNFNFRLGGSLDPPPAGDPFKNIGGLGDTAFIQWFSKSPEDSKLVFGAGWNWMFPTASNDNLGTGKYSVGPSMVAIYLGDKAIVGGVVQQYFSIGGDAARTRVSYMDIQAIYRLRMNPMFSLGGSPNIKWDQVTGQWTVPIGFGFDTMTMWNEKPARFGAEFQYYVSHRPGASPTSRSFDPEWTIRFYFSPIIPAPEWAKSGIGRR